MRPRPPRKWNLPLTYRRRDGVLKLDRVRAGTDRQTIRPGLKYRVGDLVSFHGWEGLPYRSRWTGRTPYFELKKVIGVVLRPDGIGNHWICILPWSDHALNEIARLDGIDPPTGEELGRILMQMHDIPPEGKPFQIIRW